MQAGVLDLIDRHGRGPRPASPPEVGARRPSRITQAILLSQARGNVKVQLEELAPAELDTRRPIASARHPCSKRRSPPCVLPHIAVPMAARAPAPSSAQPATSRSSTSSMRPAAACRGRPPGAAPGRARRRSPRPARRPMPAAAGPLGVGRAAARRSGGRASCWRSPATSRRTSRRAAAQRVDKTKIVPKLFIKPSSSIIGPGEAVALPTVSNALDWELELAIVIGTRGRDIPLAKARDYIARLLGHQRHLGPLDAVGRRGPRAGRLRRLLRLAQRQVGRRLRGAGARGSPRPTRSSPTRTSSR